MDFTQRNKINSCFPPQNQNRVMNQQFNHNPHPQYPKFEPRPSYQSYQQQQQRDSPHQRHHGDGNDRMMSMSRCCNYRNNCMAPQKSQFFDNSLMIKQQHEPDQMRLEDQMVTMPDEDLNIEFYHCTPQASPKAPAAVACNRSTNPFTQFCEPAMQNFSDAKPASENNQTFFFRHNGDDVTEGCAGR